MDWLKDAVKVVDLGVTAFVVAGGFFLLVRPPKWIQTVVKSHHDLAQGVRSMSESLTNMPRREEIQDLLIGQEALRRETADARRELQEARGEIRALRRD
jgi:hypothetical protein